MRRDHNIVSPQQRIVRRWRFNIGHVQAGAKKMPAIEGGRQRRFVDVPAARDIDEDRARFHLGKALGIHELEGLVIQRQMQRDKVRAAQQLRQRIDFLDPQLAKALSANVGIVGGHLHADGAGDAADMPADPPQADQAQLLLIQLQRYIFAPEILARAACQHAIKLVGNALDVARYRHHQGDGLLGCGDRGRVRRVGHGDVARGRGLDIDLVVTDAGARDDQQARRPVHGRAVINAPARHDAVGFFQPVEWIGCDLLARGDAAGDIFKTGPELVRDFGFKPDIGHLAAVLFASLRNVHSRRQFARHRPSQRGSA